MACHARVALRDARAEMQHEVAEESAAMQALCNAWRCCRYTWVDDLYFYYKHREADAGATADSMRLEHMASSFSGATAASAGTADAADATAEAAAGAAEEAAAGGDPGGNAAGEGGETRELTEEEVAAKAAERHEWMKGDVRRSMREARLLAKLIVRPCARPAWPALACMCAWPASGESTCILPTRRLGD